MGFIDCDGKGQGRPRKRDRKMKVPVNTIAANRVSDTGTQYGSSTVAAEFPHTVTQYGSSTIAANRVPPHRHTVWQQKMHSQEVASHCLLTVNLGKVLALCTLFCHTKANSGSNTY